MLSGMTQGTDKPVLAGKVIAVTSADQGYGRLISGALAEAGADIILVGNNSAALATAASMIERRGMVAIPLTADVSVSLDWKSVIGRVQDIFGQLHGVIHLADRRAHGNELTLTESEWLELFGRNLKSTMIITQQMQRDPTSTWLTLVGTHLDEQSLFAHAQRGALEELVRHSQGSARMNLVLPSRASSGDAALDRPLIDAVLALALPTLSQLRGSVLEIPLAPVPKREGETR